MNNSRKKYLKIFKLLLSVCPLCSLCFTIWKPKNRISYHWVDKKVQAGFTLQNAWHVLPDSSPSQSSVYLKLWCSYDVQNAFNQSFALLVAGTVSQQWTQIVHDSSFSKPLLMSVQLHLSLISSVTLNARKTWTQLETFSKRNFAVCSTDSVPELLLTGRHIYMFS